MPIVNFVFDKIHIEKKKKPTGSINIKNNASITNLELENLPQETKNSLLKINFTFTTKYEPNIAEVNLTGALYYADENKKIKEILNTWKNKKTMSKELMSSILNTVLIKCNIKTLALSEELNLPPQIPLPKLTQQEKESNYIG